MEQRFQQDIVRARQRVFELHKPIIGGNRYVFRLVEHWAFLVVGRLCGAVLLRSLYPIEGAQEGRDEMSAIRPATGSSLDSAECSPWGCRDKPREPLPVRAAR